MRESGRMIKLMDEVSIFTQMVPTIQGTGIKIYSMAKAKKFGQMVLHMKGSFILGKNRVKENSTLLMVEYM